MIYFDLQDEIVLDCKILRNDTAINSSMTSSIELEFNISEYEYLKTSMDIIIKRDIIIFTETKKGFLYSGAFFSSLEIYDSIIKMSIRYDYVVRNDDFTRIKCLLRDKKLKTILND